MFTGKGLLAIIGSGLLVTALLAGILIYRPFSGPERADGPIPPTLFTPLGTPASAEAPLAHTPTPPASPSSLAPTPAPVPAASPSSLAPTPAPLPAASPSSLAPTPAPVPPASPSSLAPTPAPVPPASPSSFASTPAPLPPASPSSLASTPAPLPPASPSSLAPNPAPSPALQLEGQLVTLTLSQERANALLREGIAQRGSPGQNQFALEMAEDKLTISGQAKIGEYDVSTPGVAVVFDGLKATLEGPVQVSGLRLSLRGDAGLNVERGQLTMAILRLSIGRIPLQEGQRQSLERIINEQFSALKLDLPAHLVEVRLQEGKLIIIGRNP